MKTFILSAIVIACFSCNITTQSKPEPVTVTAPTSQPSNFVTDDSSYVKINMLEGKYEVDFLKHRSALENMKALDSFFQSNTKLIDKEKIVITGFDSAKNRKELTDLLAKYGIVKLRINTKENP